MLLEEKDEMQMFRSRKYAREVGANDNMYENQLLRTVQGPAHHAIVIIAIMYQQLSARTCAAFAASNVPEYKLQRYPVLCETTPCSTYSKYSMVRNR